MKYLTAVLVLAWAVVPSNSWSKDDPTRSPQAGGRTYAQNYKDMVLADCIATAYKSEPEAAQDAGSSASAAYGLDLFRSGASTSSR
ncbi:type VI secretion system (T6SS) amidase immunity protein Tai4 [Pseudomonas sp. URMO17WK12:I6]|nr:type VI secretion system (T6SS) amidase immunity protein Tai4 [Pseudomonas sp. URMO17WK12:I6]